MYIPTPSATAVMASDKDVDEAARLNPEVTSTAKTSLQIRWMGNGQADVSGFRVTYHQASSKYVQESRLLASSTDTYNINNLVADTYYRVCVSMFQNASQNPSTTECLSTSTSSWGIPVSVGSSMGALLTLCIIVVIVLLARCPRISARSPRSCRTAAVESSKYDSMSFNGHGEVVPGDMEGDDGRSSHAASQGSQGSIGKHHLIHNHNHHNHHNHHHPHPHHQHQRQQPQQQQQHKSPMSLAERVYASGSGSSIGTPRVRQGGRGPPLAKCGRAVSLTDGRYQPSAPYRARQARLSRMHAQFQSIQSEPGGVLPPGNMTTSGGSSITDFPASVSSHSSDILSSRRDPSCGPHCPFNSGEPLTSHTCNFRSRELTCGSDCPFRGRSKGSSRHGHKLESIISCSEPNVVVSDSRTRAPVLGQMSKTIHLSMEADTMV